jgi:hypothetical protein
MSPIYFIAWPPFGKIFAYRYGLPVARKKAVFKKQLKTYSYKDHPKLSSPQLMEKAF